MPTSTAPVPSVAPGSTAVGATTLRRALRRLETLASIAITVAVLALVENYLSWSGVFGKIPTPGSPFDVSWTVGVQIGVAIALAVVIAILVIIAIVTAILGFLAWRQGVLAMVAASAEYGPSHVEACRRARTDHSRTLWMILGIVLAAIAVSIAFAGINGAFFLIGVGTIPGVVGSVATNLATGAVLVAVYFFGTRHLIELLSAVATPTENTLLFRGRTRMLAGAVVGLGAAFAPVSWGFGVFAIVSLAMILPGVRDMVRAYDLWLAAHHGAPAASGTPGPATT